MIYLVSDKITLPYDTDIGRLSVQESIDMVSGWPVVQFDTETTGLDCHVNSLTSMQFGYKDFKSGNCTAIVVDCSCTSPELYKSVIEDSYLIGHNLKFDLKFLYNFGIVPLRVYDTMICEQVLYLGYKPGTVSYKLGDVLLRNTGIEIDKSFQSEIAVKRLTLEGITYSAHDVMYLQDIRKAQMTVAKSRKCVKALTLESSFVPAIAYLEWCGIHLDEEKWKKKMENDRKVLEECRSRLDDYVRNSTALKDKFVSSYSEASLFDSNFVSSVIVDWSSSRQVVPVLQELGFNTKTKDKKTKLEKDSAEEKVISTQKGIADDFLSLYFDYKGAEKNVSSYGQGHLNLINPNTGRLHTVFTQIGTTTGRMSSGSRSPNRDLARVKKLFPEDVRFVNLQNLPSKGDDGKICRSCFTSTGTNVFISCDYAAEESRVQADVWNEKKLLDSFEHGIDTHNLYAKLCFPDELKDVDVKDVKKLRPDLRQKAKSAEFAVGYGSDGTSIAANIGMPIDRVREMVQNLLKGMPGMANFKKEATNFVKKYGYIIINKDTGHRVYWPEWSRWKADADRMDAEFMQNYTLYHKGTDDEVCKMVRRHFQIGHDWFEKNVLNYPIQGGSAIVLKEAMVNLFKWVVRHGYFGKILFCVMVHDECDVECPAEIADDFAKVMQDIMAKAAAKYYHKLPIPAEASIGDHWIH